MVAIRNIEILAGPNNTPMPCARHGINPMARLIKSPKDFSLLGCLNNYHKIPGLSNLRFFASSTEFQERSFSSLSISSPAVLDDLAAAPQ